MIGNRGGSFTPNNVGIFKRLSRGGTSAGMTDGEGMRRAISRLVLFGLLALSVLFVPFSGNASAAPAQVASAPGHCPHAQPYPPTPNATVQSSTTHPKVGQTIEASGIHYCPNENVRLTIGGKFVGNAHTNSVGAFDPPVVVPGPVGNKLLCGVGASGLPNDRDCLTLFISARGTSGGSSGGGTSFTGVEIGAMIAIAALLLVGGVVFLRAGQRRKQSVAG